MWNLERWYWWTCLQSRNRVTDVENKLMVTKGDRRDGTNWEIGIDTYTLLCIKQLMRTWVSLVGQRVKNPPARGLGSIPGLGKYPGGGHGIPLQYSCLENPYGQNSLVGCSPWGCRVGHDWVTKHTQHSSIWVRIRYWKKKVVSSFNCLSSFLRLWIFSPDLVRLWLFRKLLAWI